MDGHRRHAQPVSYTHLLIASGGVSCLQDLIGLNEAGIPAVVFGKAIYEGRISLNELAEWAENKG